METTPLEEEGRSDLPSELGFALAPRETDPAPVVTRSSEVSRAESTSAMVTSRAALRDNLLLEYSTSSLTSTRVLACDRMHIRNIIIIITDAEIKVTLSQ